MTLIDLGPPPSEPVTLAEVKTWCRIERDDEDGLLLSLTKAARETIEAMTRTILVRRAFRLALDDISADGWTMIERVPLRAVTAITAYDAKGTSRAFAPSHSVIERALGIEAIRVSAEVVAAAANGLDVDFDAGFDAGAAPEGLKLAIKRIVSASYEVRAAVPASQQPGIVPPAAEALIAPYRRVRI